MEEKINDLLERGCRPQAICLLEEYLDNRTDEAWLLRLGELLYAEGRMTEALNRFNAVIRLNPENKKALNYVTMIRGILDYYNKELLNP